MAKKRKKSGSARLPKRIAGVKLPKELRKSGNALIATAASPVGREVLRAGMAALAGTALAKLREEAAPRDRSTAAQTKAEDRGARRDPAALGAQFARNLVAALGGLAVERATSTPEKPTDT